MGGGGGGGGGGGEKGGGGVGGGKSEEQGRVEEERLNKEWRGEEERDGAERERKDNCVRANGESKNIIIKKRFVAFIHPGKVDLMFLHRIYSVAGNVQVLLVTSSIALFYSVSQRAQYPETETEAAILHCIIHMA